ncbi:hypothetical protein [Mucilaginibacter antarcticus]|uniref:hypothetical protein n=1 Tax=Mucilaginibacter antarcticus TaxID=1855725 RepID=UPI003640E52C
MTPLAKKLFIKARKSWLLYKAPENYLSLLEPLPEGATIRHQPEGDFDGVQIFVTNTDELVLSLKTISPVLKPDTIFWITYPKRVLALKVTWK